MSDACQVPLVGHGSTWLLCTGRGKRGPLSELDTLTLFLGSQCFCSVLKTERSRKSTPTPA